MTALAIIIGISLVAAVFGVAITLFWADEGPASHRVTADGRRRLARVPVDGTGRAGCGGRSRRARPRPRPG